MPVRLYMDVHVPQAITDQLRRREVDVLTAIEDGQGEIDDSALLDRARSLDRLLFTQDILSSDPSDWTGRVEHLPFPRGL
jgi:hypothetical protein